MECFCSAGRKQYKRLGRLEDDKCDTACQGEQGKTCGGTSALEVFRIKNLDYDEEVSAPM